MILNESPTHYSPNEIKIGSILPEDDHFIE